MCKTNTRKKMHILVRNVAFFVSILLYDLSGFLCISEIKSMSAFLYEIVSGAQISNGTYLSSGMFKKHYLKKTLKHEKINRPPKVRPKNLTIG